MGTGRGLLDLLQTLVIAICITHQAETQEAGTIYGALPEYTQPDYEVLLAFPVCTEEDLRTVDLELEDSFTALPEPRPMPRMTFIPTGTVTPYASASNPSHNGQVCSTWGSFHYKTFDGDIFQLPGLCNYVFASHCQAAYEDFNIQIRRSLVGETPTISRILIKTEGTVLELSPGSILINGQREQLPYSRSGFTVEASSTYVQVSVRMVLTFMWNGNDSALLELATKYANQTCGLCGDFNGHSTYNEFYSNNARLTTWQFGNLQKLDGPTEQCQDPVSSPVNNCTAEESSCLRVLTDMAFSGCNQLVEPKPYVEACVQDLCGCKEANRSSCVCATFSEYSRQCAHAGGQPLNWRSQDLCYKACPSNMQYHECGSPCADTCSNPERSQLCEEHCIDGCFCPPGTVLDDIQGQGCVTQDQCHCTHNGQTYKPGASFSTRCSSCTCLSGLWQCEELPCSGTCSVEGGSHITTFDQKHYNVHGDCSYVLSKKCEDATFTILGELRRCGMTENENCLKSVTLNLNGGETVIRIQSNGGVLVNSIYTQLPISAADITIFQPTTYFVLVHAAFGLLLQIQLVPFMQVSVRLDPSFRGQMCGLCGNFNQNQADDFTAISGVVEGTGAAFANTWKTQADCANVKNSFENPCSLSIENENYAQHWCSLLMDPGATFSQCHVFVNPEPYYKNCMFDTCNCEKSEDCLCAALSSYVQACAAQGVLLRGWRAGVCTKYMDSCPSSLSYSYVVKSCQPTCRSLSETDVTCSIHFSPVDGCVCPDGTYLNDAGQCVPATQCPCYYKGTMVALGETVQENSIVCSCTSGKLSCFGVMDPDPVCTAPMIYLDCSNTSAGAPGAQCQKSCDTLDVACYNPQCVSGCICPSGLVKDGNICVKEEDCPCVHNEASYKSGETIQVDCNKCICKNRRWECTQVPCLGTCAVYGDGHFITFDSERYSFEGNCEYTLAQDYCGGNTTTNGTFRVITENIPCGTTGVTCSKAIKVFLKGTELIFNEGTVKMVERGPGKDVPYKIHSRGIYMVLETQAGMVLMWDRKTSIFIKLDQHYKGKVCGLCGNYDGNSMNDFTTRSLSVVGDVQEFGNSWKSSPSCPDAVPTRDPCTANPYRKAWAQKQCSIINSAVFAACRSQVDSTKYYEACVLDACACDSGGDCECFCTAVAAYAQACNDVGVCVSWRKPDICPMFCDFYNPHGECDWHYQPCGAPCLKTCRNPSGKCLVNLPGLEGCYPNCPAEKPFFSESQMKCVAQCGCYDEDGRYHEVGDKVLSQANCQSCNCTTSGIQCTPDQNECTCLYEGHTYHIHEVIYNTTDGLGACLIAICGDNGEIKRMSKECPVMHSTTAPFTFTTSRMPESTAGPATTISATSTVCVREDCAWSNWYDSSTPGSGLDSGDFETFEDLRLSGYRICSTARDVECRARAFPGISLGEVGQKVECSLSHGLRCYNAEQSPPLCHDYEIRVLCCSYVPCGGSTAVRTSPPTTRYMAKARASTMPPKTLSTLTSQMWSTPTRASTPNVTCQPRCQWTEWFDTDYPTSEKTDGDIETYDKIRKTGKDFCQEPQGIECQAENYPDMTIEQVGQVVHCDVHFGFICRNEEQKGVFKMCINYKIKVLCCDDSHCHGKTSVMPPATTLQLTTSLRTGTTAQTSLTNTSLVTESSPASTATQESTPITLLSTQSSPRTRTKMITTSLSTSSSVPHPPTAFISSTARTSAVSISTPLPTMTKTVEVTTAATASPRQTTVKTSSPPIHSSTEATQMTQRPPQTPKTPSLLTTSLVTESSPASTATQESTPITLLSTQSSPRTRTKMITTSLSTSSSVPHPPTAFISSTARTSAVSISTPLPTMTKTVEVTTAATASPRQTTVKTSSPPIHSSTEATQTTQRPPQTPKTPSLLTTSLVTESSPASTATQESTPITLLSTQSSPRTRTKMITTSLSTSSSVPHPPTAFISSTARTSAVSISTPLPTMTKTVEVTTAATASPRQTTVKTSSPPIHSSTEATQMTQRPPQTPKTPSLLTTSLVTESSPASTATQESTPITLLSTQSSPRTRTKMITTSLSTSSSVPHPPTAFISSTARTSAVSISTPLPTMTKTVEVTTAATASPRQTTVKTSSPPIHSSTEATQTTQRPPQTPKTPSLLTTSLVTESSPASTATQESTPITLLSTQSSPRTRTKMITTSLSTSSSVPHPPTAFISSTARTSAMSISTPLPTMTKTVEVTTAATASPRQTTVKTSSPPIHSSTEATQMTQRPPQTPKTPSLLTTSLVTESSPASTATQESTPITLLSTQSSPRTRTKMITTSLSTSSSVPHPPTAFISSTARTSAVSISTPLPTMTKTVEVTTAATASPRQTTVKTSSPPIHSSTEATQMTQRPPQTPKTPSLLTTSLVTESSPASTATQESTPITLLSTQSSPRTRTKMITTSLSTSSSVPHPPTAFISSTARTSAVSISTPLPTMTKTVEVTTAATASPRQTTVKTSSPPIHSSTEATQMTQRPPQTPKTPSLLTTSLVTESSPASTATQESTPITLLSTQSPPRTRTKMITTSLSTSSSVPHPPTAFISSTARTSAVSISTPLPTMTKTVEVTTAATASPRQTTVKTSSPPIHSSTEATQTTQRRPQTPKTPSLLTTSLVTESSPASTATQESTPITLLSTQSPPRTRTKMITTSLSTSSSVPHPPTAFISSTARTSAVSISTPLPTMTKTVEVTTAATASPRQTTVKTSSPPIHSSTETTQTTQRPPQTPKTPSLLTTSLVTESSPASTATQESTPITLLSTQSSPRTRTKMITTSLSTSSSVPHPPTAFISSTARTSAVSISTPLPTMTKTVEVTTAATASPRQTTVKTSSPPIHSSTEATQTTQRPPQTPKTPSLLTTSLVTESSPASTATQESTPITLLSTQSSPRTRTKMITTSLSTSSSVPHPPTAFISSTARTSAVSISTPLPTMTKTVEVTTAATASPRQTTVKTSSPPIHSSTEATQMTQRPPQTPKTPSLLTTSLVTESSPASTATQESTPITLLSTQSPPRTRTNQTTTSLSTSSSVPHPPTAFIISSTARTSAVSISTPLPTMTKTVEVTTAATASPRQTTVKTSSPPIHSSTEAIQTTKQQSPNPEISTAITWLNTVLGSQTTTLVPSGPTSTIATISQIPTLFSTPCQPKCEWTEWFDMDFPVSGINGGDTETYDNIRKAGGTICQQPQKLECRAENYPEVSIDQIGQVLQCSLKFGLICRNEDQKGTFNMCFNYNIRVLCCDDYTHCPSTVAGMTTQTSSPFTLTSKTIEPTQITSTSQSTISNFITSTSTLPTSTKEAISTTQSVSVTVNNITHTSSGSLGTTWKFTSSKPLTAPQTVLTPSGQFTTARTFPLESTTARPNTLPTSGATKVTKVPKTTPGSLSTSSSFGTTSTSQKTAFSPITSGTTTATLATECQPRCVWTDWFDQSYPIPGKDGGDFETYDNIRAAGETICAKPREIQCRAENYFGMPIDQLGQVVECNVDIGLVCRNQDQAGPTKYCLNYHIRVFCCDDYSHCRTTPSPTSTASTESTSWATSSTSITATSASSRSLNTSLQTSGLKMETSKATQGKTEKVTSSVPLTSLQSTPAITSPTGPSAPTTAATSSLESTTARPNTLPTSGATKVTKVPKTTPGSLSTSSSFGTTSTSQKTAFSPITSGTTMATLATECQPRCVWTDWFDQSYPIPGKDGGDFETYDNIRAAGETICAKPREIQCRAENYFGMPIDQLGQVVECNVDIGLVCRNQDQAGPTKYCLNYHIRVFCCDDYSHCRTTPSPTSTASTESTSWATSSTSITATSASSRSLNTSLQTSGLKMETSKATQGKTEKVTSSVPLTSLQSTPAITSPTGPSAPTTAATSSLESTTARPNTLPTSGATKVTKVPKTTPGSLSTSSSFGTTSTSQKTAFSPITSGTTMATLATECQPRCVWTDWFDQSYPIPGKDGGDFETYDNIRAAGKTICAKPREIQCRAENYFGMPIDQLGQVVECNVDIGLVCRNQDQAGPTKYCLNYHIRVFCCDDYSHCRTTPSPTSTASTESTSWATSSTSITATSASSRSLNTSLQTSGLKMETSKATQGKTEKVTSSVPLTSLQSTPAITSPTSPSAPTTAATSSLESTTARPNTLPTSGATKVTKVPKTTPGSLSTSSSFGTTSTSQKTAFSPITSGTTMATLATECQPRCVWTDWFDQSYPIPGKDGGDFETYDNIRAAGETICAKPREIQCRAENYFGMPIDQLGQVVECNVDIGLVCRNQDQAGRFQMCFNYYIRVLCCDYTHCSTTPRPTTTPSTGTLSTLETHPGSTAMLSTLITTSSITPTGSRTPNTQCMPQCRWTEWFDTDKPREGRYGGDIETYYRIMDTGGKICLEPTAIECQSTLYPDLPLDQLKQVVMCNVDFGLICRNSHQKAPETMCLNYQIRVFCCDDYSHCGTTPSPTSTASTESTSWAMSSTSITATSASSRSLNTSLQTSGLKTETSKATQGKTEKVTSSVPLTSLQSTPAITSPTSPSAPTTAATSSLESTTERPNTLPTSGATKVTKVPKTTPGSLSTSSSFGTTSTSQKTAFNPITSGTTMATLATECQPRCVWTDWFDQSYPIPGKDGGDFETYDNIRAAGKTICAKPREIQCRAENYFGMPSDQLGQVVECNVDIGLVCRNQDQAGPTKYCLNYHIRVLCCDDYSPCVSISVPSHSRTTHVSRPTLQTSTISTFSTSVSIPPVSQTSPVPSTFTTPCFCFVVGDLFSPGDVIYNKTDKAGCSFFAICNQQCEIERFHGPCPTPTSSVPSSTVSQTIPPPGCYDVFPPRQPGEQWTSNCQDCICDNNSLTVQCRPVQCLEPTTALKCQKEGFVIVYEPQPEDPCCMEARCVCNQSSCPQDRPSCKPQEEVFSILPTDSCCPVFGCKERMCEQNGTTYGIGSTVPSEQPCHTCTCRVEVNPDTNSMVWCEAEQCSIACAPDQEYKVLPGQCCGQCVPATCLTPDGKRIKFNETWVDTSADNCTEYRCEKVDKQTIVSRRPTECPDVPVCKGVLRKAGCCYECEEIEEDCQVQSNETLLQYEGCVSETAVNLTFCAGSCNSMSVYSLEANEIQRKCTCCQETQTHQEEVKMKCPDGREIQRMYTHVDACSCTSACLPSHSDVVTR